MIFSENRCPLFGIMLWRLGRRAGNLQRAAASCRALMQEPLRQCLRTILTLMGAAAFGAVERRLRDGARHRQHVAQVEPFEPLQIKCAPSPPSPACGGA